MSEDNFGGDMETNLDLEKGWFGKTKDWLIDNWQTIIIVLIVLIIGVGLYNYQQQKSAGTGEESAFSTAINEQEEATENSDEEIAFENDWSSKEGENDSAIVIEESEEETENLKLETENKEGAETNDADKDSVTIASENGKEYTVSADRGDGITQLARKALKKYLNENGVSDINDEQKIYAEDYLQNKTGQEFLELGETREFSEDLIAEAIDLSRGLDDSDIENLSKYKSRIANL